MKLKIVKIIISVKFGTTFVDSDTFSCVRLWRTRASGKGGGKEDSVVRIENAWILYYVYIYLYPVVYEHNFGSGTRSSEGNLLFVHFVRPAGIHVHAIRKLLLEVCGGAGQGTKETQLTEFN